MNNIETITYKGKQIETWYDNIFNEESPNDWDNEIQLIYDHRNFNIESNGFNCYECFERYEQGFKTFQGYWILPVYAYIHSGVNLSLTHRGCQWDTSFKGFILIKRGKYYWKYKDAVKAAEGQLETWNYILSGSVYGYSTDAESCGGFIGDYEYMVKEAKELINNEIELNKKAHFIKLKTWINNHVPLIYRQSLIVYN